MKDLLLLGLALAACFGFGLFALIRPETIWKLEHWFDVEGGEPTEFYINRTRLLGAGFVIFSTFGTLFLILFAPTLS